MARVTLTVQEANRNVKQTTFTAVTADGIAVENNEDLIVLFKSTHTAPITVTALVPSTSDDNVVADRDVVIPIGSVTEQLVPLGNFAKNIYNQANGMLWFDATPITTLEVALLKKSAS